MTPARPLIVRLRNFIGDVVLALPTLQRLQDAGFALQLVGKPWARSLLEGHDWPVHPYPRTTRERVALLRNLRRQALATEPGFGQRLNAVCFPWSFSSALEMRLAGLRAVGHAHEGRRWLLRRAVARRTGDHEMAVYWDLAEALLGTTEPVPAQTRLQVSDAQHARAAALLRERGVQAAPIVLVPFASTAQAQRERGWPPFANWAAQALPALGRPLVVCPGPGEEAQAARDFPGAVRLDGVPLGTYAAVLAQAALVLAIDTGPGHMAAAVGAPTVSILGAVNPQRWGVRGARSRIVRRQPGWPTEEEVMAAAQAALASGRH